jgi:hypothetical protein
VVEAVEGDLVAAADTAAVDRLMVVAEAADLAAAAAMAHHVEAVTAVDIVREEDRDTALTKSVMPDMPRRTRPRSHYILT